jgi:hypothetical protein
LLYGFCHTQRQEKVRSLIPAQKYLSEVQNAPVLKSIGPLGHVLMEDDIAIPFCVVGLERDNQVFGEVPELRLVGDLEQEDQEKYQCEDHKQNDVCYAAC